VTLPHVQCIHSLERPQNEDGPDSWDDGGVKVHDDLLVDGAARLTDFSCGQVHLVGVTWPIPSPLVLASRGLFNWMTPSSINSSPGRVYHGYTVGTHSCNRNCTHRYHTLNAHRYKTI